MHQVAILNFSVGQTPVTNKECRALPLPAEVAWQRATRGDLTVGCKTMSRTHPDRSVFELHDTPVQTTPPNPADIVREKLKRVRWVQFRIAPAIVQIVMGLVGWKTFHIESTSDGLLLRPQ